MTHGEAKAGSLVSMESPEVGILIPIALRPMLNRAAQSWDLEVSAVVDVMATAMVELKLDGSEWEITPVALPIIKQLILSDDPAVDPEVPRNLEGPKALSGTRDG